MILLLAYVIWRIRAASGRKHSSRRRRSRNHATSSDKARNNLTALPMYQHERRSVPRCSKSQSVLDALKDQVRVKTIQLPTQKSPEMEPRPKEFNVRTVTMPLTPMTERSFFNDSSPASPVIEKPRKARVPRNRRTMPAMRYTSRMSRSIGLTVSTNKANAQGGKAIGLPETPTTPYDRWSWTNSQAPTTPRITASNKRFSRASIVSLPRSVSSWLRTQRALRTEDPINLPPKRKASLALKNQASKPLLAPPLQVQSRLPKHLDGHGGGLASLFRTRHASVEPALLSPRLMTESQRPSTSPSVERRQDPSFFA